MRYRRYAYVFSIALILAGAASVLLKGGFRLGVDFAGGVLVEYRFDRPVEADELRMALSGLEAQRVQHGAVQREDPAGGPGENTRTPGRAAPGGGRGSPCRA